MLALLCGAVLLRVGPRVSVVAHSGLGKWVRMGNWARCHGLCVLSSGSLNRGKRSPFGPRAHRLMGTVQPKEEKPDSVRP